MNLDPVDDQSAKSKLKEAFAQFKQKNETVVKGSSLMPANLSLKSLQHIKRVR